MGEGKGCGAATAFLGEDHLRVAEKGGKERINPCCLWEKRVRLGPAKGERTALSASDKKAEGSFCLPPFATGMRY